MRAFPDCLYRASFTFLYLTSHRHLNVLQPLELWTKYGRRGRIKEPVGTHGTCLCRLGRPIECREIMDDDAEWCTG